MIYCRQTLKTRPKIFEIFDRNVDIVFNLICFNFLIGQSKFLDIQAVAKWIAEIISL